MKTFVLFLVIANTNPADDGRDSWFALDGNLSRVDCFAAALDMERHKAAQTLFGKWSDGVEISLVCEEDNAPETWGN